MPNTQEILAGTYEGMIEIETDLYDRADAYVRNSHLNLIRRSPAHCKFALDNPSGGIKTPAMALGTALHCRILEPDEFDHRFAVKPDVDARTKSGKTELEEFKRWNSAKTLITATDLAHIEGMALKVFESQEAKTLLTGGRAEVSCFWKEDQTQAKCKARLDYFNIPQRYILDVKTTDDCGRLNFARSIARYGYARQAAYYAMGASYVTAQDIDDFIFLAIEKDPPYEFAIYRLDYGSLEKGRTEIFEALVKFKQCRDDGVWPGYPRKVEDIALPNWAFSDTYT